MDKKNMYTQSLWLLNFATSIKTKILLLAMLVFCSVVQSQNYSGGAGTVADPYQMSNLADLEYLSANM